MNEYINSYRDKLALELMKRVKFLLLSPEHTSFNFDERDKPEEIEKMIKEYDTYRHLERDYPNDSKYFYTAEQIAGHLNTDDDYYGAELERTAIYLKEVMKEHIDDILKRCKSHNHSPKKITQEWFDREAEHYIRNNKHKFILEVPPFWYPSV